MKKQKDKRVRKMWLQSAISEQELTVRMRRAELRNVRV
jgi:hypothetical protein